MSVSESLCPEGYRVRVMKEIGDIENLHTRSVILNLCINPEYSRARNAPLGVSSRALSSLFLAMGDDVHRLRIFSFTSERSGCVMK